MVFCVDVVDVVKKSVPSGVSTDDHRSTTTVRDVSLPIRSEIGINKIVGTAVGRTKKFHPYTVGRYRIWKIRGSY